LPSSQESHVFGEYGASYVVINTEELTSARQNRKNLRTCIYYAGEVSKTSLYERALEHKSGIFRDDKYLVLWINQYEGFILNS
jgi:hypothetical protein